MLLKSRATPPASLPIASIFCACRRFASSAISWVASRPISTNPTVLPSATVIGAIVFSSWERAPSRRRLTIRPCHMQPASRVVRIVSQKAAPCRPLRMISGVPPMASARLQPVTASNRGVTKVMTLSASVIRTVSGACSIAALRSRHSRSRRRRSVMSSSRAANSPRSSSATNGKGPPAASTAVQPNTRSAAEFRIITSPGIDRMDRRGEAGPHQLGVVGGVLELYDGERCTAPLLVAHGGASFRSSQYMPSWRAASLNPSKSTGFTTQLLTPRR